MAVTSPIGSMRLMLLGVGAMNSPLYLPARLLVRWHGRRVMLDGGAWPAGAHR